MSIWEILGDRNQFFGVVEVNKFLLTIFLCGIIGAEREYRSKSAGLKTMIMIGLGSALFTVLSLKMGDNSHDRIAANIVTGIGFLGAGVIFKEENRVKGLTTACVIWIVAAIGMAVGSGFFIQAIGVTGVVVISLIVFPQVENIAERRFTKRTYRIVKTYNRKSLDEYEQLFKRFKLKPSREKHQFSNGIISGTWTAVGNPNAHQRFVNTILKDESIIEFDF
jgi:putative Mg2+ transporter-C (MgtC) family protein